MLRNNCCNLKGANGAFCGCKSANLLNNIITILGVAHSYHSDVAEHQNFVNLLDKTQSILNIWDMRSLSLSDRVQIFKTCAVSKLNYLPSVSNLPKAFVNQLTIMQKRFIWNNKPPKIKHSSLIAPCSEGRLNNVDAECILRSLQLLQIVNLSDPRFEPSKIIPKLWFETYDVSLPVERNYCIEQSKIRRLPPFYQMVIKNWIHISKYYPVDAEDILHESLWHNAHMKTGGRPIFDKQLSDKGHNTISGIFTKTGKLLHFNMLQEKGMHPKYYRSMQILDAIPNTSKTNVRMSLSQG